MAAAEDIGIVLLAAGASKRMGQPKQLLSYQGESMLQRMVRIGWETPFRPMVVVLGSRAEKMERELEGAQAHIVYNSAWQAGMGSSVATGMEALLRQSPQLKAAFFILVDQPYLSAGHLRKMADELQGHPEKLGAASAYANTLGVPALFKKALFPELLKLHGEKGAKTLLVKYAGLLLPVPFPKGEVDLDRPEDWRAFTKKE